MICLRINIAYVSTTTTRNQGFFAQENFLATSADALVKELSKSFAWLSRVKKLSWFQTSTPTFLPVRTCTCAGKSHRRGICLWAEKSFRCRRSHCRYTPAPAWFAPAGQAHARLRHARACPTRTNPTQQSTNTYTHQHYDKHSHHSHQHHLHTLTNTAPHIPTHPPA